MATMPKPLLNTKRIEVFQDGHAESDPEHLSIYNNEEALFSTKRSKHDVEVVFDINGTPFSSDRFLVKAGMEILSGPLRNGVKPGEEYRYNVHSRMGTAPGTDPTIIIDQ